MLTSSQLDKAIDAATLERLRATLHFVCAKSKVASKLVSAALLVPDDAAGTSRKRKASEDNSTLRYETCVQCKEEYDTTTNDKYSCQWHDGRAPIYTCSHNTRRLLEQGELELDPDPDCWVDDDAPNYIKDSAQGRKDNPGGFCWTCCEVYGDEIVDKQYGCMRGHHLSVAQSREKSRPDWYRCQNLDSPSVTSESEVTSSEDEISNIDDDDDDDDDSES